MDILWSFLDSQKGKDYVARKVKQNGLSIDESQRIKNNQFEKRLDCIRSAHNEKKDNEIRTDRMEDYLKVSSPSVTKMVKKLDENSYLIYEKYRGLRLTSQGIHIAKNIQEKHSLFVEFLKMIGVDNETAHLDAEGIEHHLHPQTIKKLERFIMIL